MGGLVQCALYVLLPDIFRFMEHWEIHVSRHHQVWKCDWPGCHQVPLSERVAMHPGVTYLSLCKCIVGLFFLLCAVHLASIVATIGRQGHADVRWIDVFARRRK